MAVTRLERKGLRNKARAKAKQQRIKELTKQPPIKNVDVEAIKEEFAKKLGKPATKKASKKEKAAEAKQAEPEVVEQEQPKAEETTEAAQDEEPKAEEVKADASQASAPQTDEPQAELREPAKAPREDAEAVEDKIEGENKDSEKES